MSRLTMLAALALLTVSLVGAPREAHAEPPPGIMGWVHLTGGAGPMLGARKVHPLGRVSFGVGGTLIFVYGGFAAEASFSSHQGFVQTGVVNAGFVIPIPAFNLLLGFKAGGGVQVDPEYPPSPAVTLGPQIAIHIGKLKTKGFGIRVAVEPDVTIATKNRIGSVGIIGTIGILF